MNEYNDQRPPLRGADGETQTTIALSSRQERLKTPEIPSDVLTIFSGVDWKLVLRTREQMRAFIPADSPPHSCLYFDPYRNVIYLLLTRSC
jgi:hypothetical protein